MANTRSHRKPQKHKVGQQSFPVDQARSAGPSRKSQQRKVQRLFQSDTLTALLGRSVGTLVTRIVVTVAVIGVGAAITVGLLHPNTASTPASLSSSGAPIGTQIGDAAPNFTLTAAGGKQVSLSDYRGKPIMLNFWYATCPGCLQEIPGMVRFYSAQQAAGKDFVILGVNIVDDAQTAQRFAQQEGMTYPIAIDDGHVGPLYSLNATPTSYFIDRQGIIRSVVVGPVSDATLQQDVAQISS